MSWIGVLELNREKKFRFCGRHSGGESVTEKQPLNTGAAPHFNRGLAVYFGVWRRNPKNKLYVSFPRDTICSKTSDEGDRKVNRMGS